MPAKKTTKKKAVKKPVASKKGASIRRAPAAAKAIADKQVGVVTHFFRKIKVAIVKLKKPVKVGTEIRFEGSSTKFSQKIVSIQYDHKPIATAPKGKQVGIKVVKRVREGDHIFLS